MRAAAIRFSRDVGAMRFTAASVDCASFAPPLTSSPGTPRRAAPPTDPVPPAGRWTGPAEKPAAREPGGVGTSVVFAGFSPTIASSVCPTGPGTPLIAGASTDIAGAADPSPGTGRPGGATKVLGTPFSPPAEAVIAAGADPASGALGSATGASLRGLVADGGGVYARRCGRAPPASNGSAFGSTMVASAGASGSCMAACRLILTSGGGVNASGFGFAPEASIGSGLAPTGDAAATGASGSAGSDAAGRAFSGGGANGSGFGFAPAASKGKGLAAASAVFGASGKAGSGLGG